MTKRRYNNFETSSCFLCRTKHPRIKCVCRYCKKVFCSRHVNHIKTSLRGVEAICTKCLIKRNRSSQEKLSCVIDDIEEVLKNDEIRT